MPHASWQIHALTLLGQQDPSNNVLWRAFIAWGPVLGVLLVLGLGAYGLVKLTGWIRRSHAVRTIDPSPEIANLKQRVYERGFYLADETGQRFVFKREGTQWTFNGERMPLQLTIVNGDGQSTLTLKYDTLVLYDSGDLTQLADRLATQLSGVSPGATMGGWGYATHAPAAHASRGTLEDSLSPGHPLAVKTCQLTNRQ